MTESERDFWASLRYAMDCLRAQSESGRKLTPKEMARLVQPVKDGVPA